MVERELEVVEEVVRVEDELAVVVDDSVEVVLEGVVVERELEVVEEVVRVEDELAVVVDDSVEVVLEGVVVGVVDALEDISELDWMREVVDGRLLEVLEPAGEITRVYTPAAATMITMTITAVRAVLTPL